MDDREIIKNNLKRYRKRAGLTQDKFAEKIGLSTSFYARVEQGQSVPGTDTLKKIAKALNVPIDYFLSEYDRDSRIYATAALIDRISQYSDEQLELYSDLVKDVFEYVHFKNEDKE